MNQNQGLNYPVKNKVAVNFPHSVVQIWGLLAFHVELRWTEVIHQHSFSVAVPQGEVQDWHASPLQSLQLQEPNVLWSLWHAALGPCTARTEVWWWVPELNMETGCCLQSKEPNFISLWNTFEMIVGWWRSSQEDHPWRRICRRTCGPRGWRVSS